MNARFAIFVSVAAVFLGSAHAQRPDCPPKDAVIPRSPPGPAPQFAPPMPDIPKTFGERRVPPQSGEMKLDPRERAAVADDVANRTANDWLVEGEDGHVASLARRAGLARSLVPPGAARTQVDASKTVLAAWELVGYLPEGSANRVSRIFRRGDGSLLGVVEWDFSADGGAIYAMPGMNNARIAGVDATWGGVRGPSGCIASALSWVDARKSYSLELSGPLDLVKQRALLTEVAESFAAASRMPR